MVLKPTVYSTIVNQEGQTIEFVEHPIMGDEYPIIAVYHKEKVAVCTDFFDVSDFFEGSDYNPVYMHGELKCAWEFGF